jgi:ATP-binding cassette subfamily B protein
MSGAAGGLRAAASAPPAAPTSQPALPAQRQRGILARLLGPFLRPYAAQITLVIVLLAIQGAGNLYLPRVNAGLIDNGIAAGDASYIWRIGCLMLGITAGQCVIAVIALYWAARCSAGVGKDLRAAIFARVQEFSAADLARFGAASLLTRNTNDVQQIQLFLQMALTLMVIAPIICVGGLIMAVTVSPSLSALLIVAIPVMAVLTGWLLITTMPMFRSMQARIDRINEVLREQITGVRVIRAFSRTQLERQRFRVANTDLHGASLRANRIFAVMTPGLMAILNLAGVAVLWFGGRLAGQGTLPVGDLVAFLSYVMQILLSVTIALTMAILVPRAAVSAERVREILDAPVSVGAPAHPVVPAASSGAVRFSGVSCRLAGQARPVLRELTIALQAGATTAIIGGTGSGKSTLLGLIPRLLDVTAGEVSVDGVDVRRQDPQRLRAGIGLVPQEAFLFRGTVAANLRLGKADATEAELWAALRTAQASDFVAALSGELEAGIDEGGVNLAGGQRQRLSIARAVLRRPRIYLFDDCFAALDGATEARLRSALKAAVTGATVVVAAQRVSTVADADQIVVLDDGRIVGTGAHRQLLASCAIYREIVVSQLGEEAAA